MNFWHSEKRLQTAVIRKIRAFAVRYVDVKNGTAVF